jgi:hypothetical protein
MRARDQADRVTGGRTSSKQQLDDLDSVVLITPSEVSRSFVTMVAHRDVIRRLALKVLSGFSWTRFEFLQEFATRSTALTGSLR